MIGDEFGDQTIQPLLTDDLFAVVEPHLPLLGWRDLTGEMRDGFWHLHPRVGTLTVFGGACLNLSEDRACFLAAAVARERIRGVLWAP